MLSANTQRIRTQEGHRDVVLHSSFRYVLHDSSWLLAVLLLVFPLQAIILKSTFGFNALLKLKSASKLTLCGNCHACFGLRLPHAVLRMMEVSSPSISFHTSASSRRVVGVESLVGQHVQPFVSHPFQVASQNPLPIVRGPWGWSSPLLPQLLFATSHFL